jgi:hypothetical protein
LKSLIVTVTVVFAGAPTAKPEMTRKHASATAVTNAGFNQVLPQLQP